MKRQGAPLSGEMDVRCWSDWTKSGKAIIFWMDLLLRLCRDLNSEMLKGLLTRLLDGLVSMKLGVTGLPGKYQKKVLLESYPISADIRTLVSWPFLGLAAPCTSYQFRAWRLRWITDADDRFGLISSEL